MGSGGGFRALTAFAGALTALWDAQVVDMATYIAGLSGSAWYDPLPLSSRNFQTKNKLL